MLPDLIRVSVFAVLLLLQSVQVWAHDPFGAINSEYMKNITRQAKAAEMSNYLNEHNDPCDNFYEFACGNYYRINPPNRVPFKSNTFKTISRAFSRKIRNVLKPNETTDTLAEMKVKNFFESCMNLSILRRTYALKLKELIGEFGRMPVLEEPGSWRDIEFDWLKTVSEIAYKYHIGIILGYEIEKDFANNTRHRLYLERQDFPSLSVYQDEAYALYRSRRKADIAHKLKVFFGLDTRVAEQTAYEIFEFEKLLNLNTTKPKTKDQSVFSLKPITIDEMQRKYSPDLDIKRFLNISLGYVPSAEVYDLIEDEAPQIIKALNSTSRRIVANYIFFYLMEDFMLIKPPTASELEAVCIRMTKTHFGHLIDNMVYRTYNSPQAEQDVHNMWRLIKISFERILDSPRLLWMKDSTRKHAKEKLYAMRMEINAYQERDFTRELENITLNKHDYLENLKSIFILNTIKTRNKLYETPQPTDDAGTGSLISAYILTENLIKVPGSMLQPYHLWSNSYPYAFKFATLGFLISHALIHGFDENGRAFDKTGNSVKWWDPDSNKYFKNRTKCFSQQYEKYTLSHMHSQSENIADNGGIRLAYEAYLNWYEEAAKLQPQWLDMEFMPRLNYTNKQLFFIAFGQLWCDSMPTDSGVFEEHISNEFRVIGPLSNLEEFSEAFQCPRGSGMNPLKKCIIY